MTITTQSQHPWRASLRTAGAVAVTVLLALAAAGPEIVEFVADQFPDSPAVPIVAAVSGFIVALAALVNRLMLLGPIANLLQRLGLGPAPTVDTAPKTYRPDDLT